MMITNEARKTHHITSDIAVFSEFAIDLGDNGLSADAGSSCMIAPQVNGDDVFVYLTTNGDDVIIGWLDEDGELDIADDAREWIDSDDMGWLQDILQEQFGFEA